MKPEEIYQELVNGKMFSVDWFPEYDGTERGYAHCQQWTEGARICLFSSCIHIQSIVHEVHHAVNWFSALGAINGREEEAHFCGFWTEEVISKFLRKGWSYGIKKSPGVIFNTDVNVALIKTI